MCPMILGLRVLQCPRIGTPSAARNWSPKACSSSLFLGVTTARMARPPALFCRSRILVVLPAPGSATMTCQERLCQAERNMAWNLRAKAVSMNGYVLKGEGVMLTIPLTSGASVRYGQDDQRRHLELLSSFWGEPVSSSRCPVSAQRLRRGGSLPVGDPIDVLARLHESRCYDVSAHALLRPEYANGPLALANARVSPASHRVYAWHGPPTSLCAPPSIVGNRLLQRRYHPRTNIFHEYRAGQIYPRILAAGLPSASRGRW